ncbi:MAG: hypothetical protein ABIG45_09240 [Bacillota bacterium]
MLRTGRQRALTAAAWGMLILTPFLAVGIVSLILGKNGFAAMPVWSDELDYWRSVFSWVRYGMHTGYNGIGELPPEIGVLSVHGPGPILLYAWFARAFGWGFSAIILCNALWVSAGAAALVALLRPKARTAVLLSLSMLAYAPFMLYCCTSMTEIANYGLLLLYAGLLYRLHEKLSVPALLFALLTVTFMSVYRILYFLLFLPVVIVAFGKRFSWKLALSVIAVVVFSFFINFFMRKITSPYESGFLYHFLRADFGEAARMFYFHALKNLHNYFVLELANAAEVAQRWLYCGAALFCLLGMIFRKNGRWLYGMCLTLLLLPWAVVILFYETQDWADYRSLAPFLWFVIAWLILQQKKLLPVAYFAGCAAILIMLLTGAPEGAFSDENRFDPKPFSPELQALCEAVPYDPDADDPFLNTVRTEILDIQVMAQLHPGLGVQSGIMYENNTGKSRFILTRFLRITVPGFETVMDNAAGGLYRAAGGLEE